MPVFETVILMRTFHRVQDAINDLDSACLLEELTGQASWDIDDLSNIKEITNA